MGQEVHCPCCITYPFIQRIQLLRLAGGQPPQLASLQGIQFPPPSRSLPGWHAVQLNELAHERQ